MAQEKLRSVDQAPLLRAMSSRPEPQPPARNAYILESKLRTISQSLTRKNETASPQPIPSLPHISAERLEASLSDHAFESTSELYGANEKRQTVLYLAYGSNLCYQTFQGARGIKPISQMNVVVPDLRMTFDLPGIAYAEPCFANSALRDPSNPPPKAEYNKDKWNKGMVGVVYEVTPSDYAHIIATEGGGSSYQDVLVSCHPLQEGVDIVPELPATPAFKAHTLFAPAAPHSAPGMDVSPAGQWQRPDPSYAQASARYLKLLTDGADEHRMPLEYKHYLHHLQPYTITSRKQLLGQFIYLSLWAPFILLVLEIGKRVQDERGRAPGWYAELVRGVFAAAWGSYDGFFKPLFGDGERTQGGRRCLGYDVELAVGGEKA